MISQGTVKSTSNIAGYKYSGDVALSLWGGWSSL